MVATPHAAGSRPGEARLMGTFAGMQPRVSVVMPAYNAARTLRVAVDSVLAQDFSDFELIVCDDASRDDTATLLSGYADPRLKVVRNAANLGEGGARDRAIAGACGKWIAVIDADDAWLPQRLSMLLAAAGERDDVLVFDDLVECHDVDARMVPWRRLRGGRAFGANGHDPVPVAFADLIHQRRLLIKPLFPAKLVRDHAVRHSDRRFGADTEYFLRLIEHGLQPVYVPQALYLYRLTPGSMSSTPRRELLMREVLLAAAGRMCLDQRGQAALARKIAAVERAARYADLLGAVRGGRWLAACRQLVGDPALLREFLLRLPETI
ncbi:MAG: glycosyltransferase family 2 protein, partial [Gammaproteobacteria bacterium]